MIPLNMKRIIWQTTILVLLAVRLPAQPSLEIFTNQANALLQPAFGFGVANIPVYCSTNPAAAYTASLHFLLQSAANAYDATTPATNPPSVFRPLFAWSSNTLFIVGYTNVTTDFYAQTGLGFKAPADPTIGANDNVWGIPWVVGMKNNPPAFNEYCYSTSVLAERKLLFVRATVNGQPLTNEPPVYTNQFLLFSVTNVFGVEAWNFSRSNFPDSVTIVVSNRISITVSNNYNFGFYTNLGVTTNWIINSWPGWTGGFSGVSFLVPILTNIITLPPVYYSESERQFLYLTNAILTSNTFLQSDMSQTSWPEYNWTLNITNDLTYALVDNATGLVLDFVNLGGFGSSLPIIQLLATAQSPLGISSDADAWVTNRPVGAPNSPMSSGLLYQIATGAATSQTFANDLNGVQPCSSLFILEDPYTPTDVIIQNCTWQAANPLVHYTVEDLTGAENETNAVYSLYDSFPPPLGTEISDSVCSLGRKNHDYNSGTVENLSFGLSAGSSQLNFSGVNDLPYAIWASTDLLDWSQIGIASQPSAGAFQFNDLAATNYPARFYQVRLP
jgi:hypothetical protein